METPSVSWKKTRRQRVRDVFKLLLVIPFSMLYFPLYIFVSFFGTAVGIRSLVFPKQSDVRGWNTGPDAAGGIGAGIVRAAIADGSQEPPTTPTTPPSSTAGATKWRI